MALRDQVGGWFLYPRRPERRVDDHHLAVLRDPKAYGLTAEDIERMGPRDRIGILSAVLRNGWIRVRVPPTRDAAIHIEVWNLDRTRARRIESWFRRRGLWPTDGGVQLRFVAPGTGEVASIRRLQTALHEL